MGAQGEQLKLMLMKELEDTECVPFWKLECYENKLAPLKDKLSVKKVELEGQLWRNLIFGLAFCWECHKEGLIPIASQKLLDCHTWIKNAEVGDFLRKYNNSFTHVVLSYKAFLAIESGAYSDAKRCLVQIVRKSKLNGVELAALYGIKSHLFAEYGIKGSESAFFWAREALKLNPDEPEWHFLLGKLHTRLRNYSFSQKHVDEELQSFEKAHDALKMPYTAVYLAGCYLARARTLFLRQPLVEGERVKGPGVEAELKRMGTKSMELYWEALKSNKNDCPHISARVAYGLINLPAEYGNPKTAMALAFQVLDKSPSNVMAHGVLSRIYHHNGNLLTAICHAAASAKLGSYNSHLRLIKYYTIMRRDTKDIVNLFDELIRDYPVDVHRLQTYVTASNYFLFHAKDLFRSLPYFENAIELDSRFDILKDLYIPWVKVYLNTYELMYNEIQCALSKESYVNEGEKMDLLRIKDKIVAVCPTVINYRVRNNLIDKLFNDRTPCQRGRPTRRRNANKKTAKKSGKKDVNKRKDKSKQVKRERQSAEPGKRHNELKSWKKTDDNVNFYFGTEIRFKRRTNTNLGSGKKRARSDSQHQSCKKNLDRLKDSVPIDKLSLRPDVKPMMAPGSNVASLSGSLSQLSIDSSPPMSDWRSASTNRPNPLGKKPSFDSKLSNSNVMASMTIKLTVQNLEKHRQNLGASRHQSVDSDDTLSSRLSNLSLNRTFSTDRSLPNYPPQRSCSLNPSRTVSSVSTERPFHDFRPGNDSRLSSPLKTNWSDRLPQLTQNMRDLSLERRRDVLNRPEHGQRFGETLKKTSTYDLRSPLGRQKNSERILRPPTRSSSTASSESLSSVDSDYVASRWTRGGIQHSRH